MILAESAQTSNTEIVGSTLSITRKQSPRDNDLGQLRDSSIMMVDDESITMEVIKTFLEDAGYTKFVLVEKPELAIKVMENERPDLLLLDLIMPKVSGFDILYAMKDVGVLSHIPVIILTSSTDAITKLNALELGATDFLSKPVDSSELLLRIRNTLGAKAYQDQLAYYDAITGLPNRRMFMERLGWTIKAAAREKDKCALLHIGLDRFRQINDTLGPEAGDSLLAGIANRLRLSLRQSDGLGRFIGGGSDKELSRLGGDEFAVILPRIGKAEYAAYAAKRIIKLIAQPFQLGDTEIVLTASVGISVYPNDANSPERILKNASSATFQVKTKGGKDYHFYSNKMNEVSLHKFKIEAHLRRALLQSEFLLNYQPKVDVNSGRLVGVESLIRWNHPKSGLIRPDIFIPVAEETGLIIPIGSWVLGEACRQLKEWRDAGISDINVAVNLSSLQLQQEDLEQVVKDAVNTSGLDPHHLTLELTESMVMSNAEDNIAKLMNLKDMGFKLSIDDFGTGYSSLSYLKRFPLDELKIDRSFITNVNSSEEDGAIVRAILALAKSLGLKAVAEGIETREELAFLQENNCDVGQGYFFSKPLMADELMGNGAFTNGYDTNFV